MLNHSKIYIAFILYLSCFVSSSTASWDADIRKVNFLQISGWEQDKHRDALIAFNKSCRRIINYKGKINGIWKGLEDWNSVCKKALTIPLNKAKVFFERNFQPLAVKHNDKGLFTGYYVPEISGSKLKTASYRYPLYRVPSDFKARQPYLSRRQIERGALSNKGLEIVYLKSPIDAFFLHIQGSGRIKLTDGSVMNVGFAAKNGLPYTAVGSILIKNGVIPRKDISMQSIKSWMQKYPNEAKELMLRNDSFIFFKEVKRGATKANPIGAQGVELTPGRSLAIDKKYHNYGLPIWLDSTLPSNNNGKHLFGKKTVKFRRLMIAQDTGSAIKGIVRGDVFWGSGSKAEYYAGKMKQPGRIYILLPKTLAHKFKF